jgi:hypothetical protein
VPKGDLSKREVHHVSQVVSKNCRPKCPGSAVQHHQQATYHHSLANIPETRPPLVCANTGSREIIQALARASSAGGMVRPRAFADLRLTVSWTLVDCCTGKLAGFFALENCLRRHRADGKFRFVTSVAHRDRRAWRAGRGEQISRVSLILSRRMAERIFSNRGKCR